MVSGSCGTLPKDVIRKSTIKLDGKNTNIRDWIEIDGYYISPLDTAIHYNNQDRRYFGSMMFFEDGTWVSFTFYTEVFEDRCKIQQNMSKYIVGWKNDKLVNWGDMWGVYKVENDTITVLSYDTNVFRQWYDETRYKIIDRETIQGIYYRCLDKTCENDNPWITSNPAYFTSADSLPTSDCWLKKKKWIWRNEQDWKNYMEKIKEEKIKKK